MKKTGRRILMLVHPHYQPDTATARGGTERDVWRTLRRLGHRVEVVGLTEDPRELDRALVRARPQVVFNLLEEFRGEGAFDFHPITYLESLGVAYTGCNPRGLIQSRNKFLTMTMARALGVPTPETALGARARAYPAFIKFNREHASRGITRANVVRTPAALSRAAARLRRAYPGELITQSFVRGLEVSVPVWGNARPVALAPWHLHMGPDRVATEKMKFDAQYRRRWGIRAGVYADEGMADRLRADSRRVYRALDLSGYARLDYRVADGRHYLIDVNANPNLSRDEDFASSARAAGYDYAAALTQIMTLAKSYRPAR
jgi:D-alanine-D-alanine ligase